jgi:signal transduction histidine kinase
MIAEDITERRKTEKSLESSRHQLRQLSAHLQSIREEERARMAREIHDEFGQVLTALKIDAALIERAAQKGSRPDIERVLAKTRQMTSLIDLALISVRRLATELRPGILDDLGLEAALEWQAQEFQRRTGIHCDFKSTVSRAQVPSEYSTPVFRIFQETLTNISRHAGATHVSVMVEVKDKQLSLEVEDNGRGIREEDLAQSQSLGILGMKERALLMGAEFTISGESGHGTKVALVTPLPDS